MENKIEIDEGEKKKQRNSLGFKENYLEFCRSTSLHGLQYVGEQHRPMIERLFWLLSFLVSLAFVTYFVSQTWNKWQTSPVFVTFAETSSPVWDIPFPAVTICPEIKIKRTVLNFTSLCFNLNKSIDEIEDYEKARLVCRSFTDFGLDFNENFPLGYVPNNNLSSVEGISEFLQRVGPEVDDVLDICIWRGTSLPCDELFKPVITDDGLCYTSNTMNAQEMFREGTVQRDGDYELQFPNTSLWSYEKQYSDSDSNDVYPRRAMTNGGRGGLLLLLELTKKDIDALCSMVVHGVKVILTNPADYPVDVLNQYISIPFDRNVIVGIRPRVMTTTDGLKNYLPQRRLCYFSNERYLRYFNLYTQQNCNIECLTNYTLKLCGCVTFFMPRKLSFSRSF
ncbi:hypothetical protein C0J52_20177 [Blattella germanica]|nr:hypothetical protein C0J52_20177 [Blattella germanica]PSN34456.1 hypothetical protein C0J52_20177 [Blattella germanica]